MCYLVSILPLCRMIYSDFRIRRVALADLLVFGLLQWVGVWYEWGGEIFVMRLCCNCLLFVGLGTGVAGYYLLRYGCSFVRLREQVGGGDVWFCLSLFPVFNGREWVLFLTISCLLILSVWWVYVRWKGKAVTIPLVSGLGCMYIPVILKNLGVYE